MKEVVPRVISHFVGIRGLCGGKFFVPAENADNELDTTGCNDVGFSYFCISVVCLVSIRRGNYFDLQLLAIQ